MGLIPLPAQPWNRKIDKSISELGIKVAAPSMSVDFDTRSVESPHQLDFWRESIQQAYMRLEVRGFSPRSSGFKGRIVQHLDKGLVYSEISGDPHVAILTQKLARANGDDRFMVVVQRRGVMHIEQAGRQTVLGEGEFALCSASSLCCLTMPERFHADTILIDGSALRTVVREPERFTAQSLSGNYTGAGLIFLGMVLSLREAIAHLAPTSTSRINDAIVNALGATLGALEPGDVESRDTSLAAFHRERIRLLINDRLFDPELSINAIARELKLSTRYVHLLFECESETLTRSIWRRRLQAAKSAIGAQLHRPRALSEIAYSVGFKDAAHFSRQFKATYGCTPADFRAGIARGQ